MEQADFIYVHVLGFDILILCTLGILHGSTLGTDGCLSDPPGTLGSLLKHLNDGYQAKLEPRTDEGVFILGNYANSLALVPTKYSLLSCFIYSKRFVIIFFNCCYLITKARAFQFCVMLWMFLSEGFKPPKCLLFCTDSFSKVIEMFNARRVLSSFTCTICIYSSYLTHEICNRGSV